VLYFFYHHQFSLSFWIPGEEKLESANFHLFSSPWRLLMAGGIIVDCVMVPSSFLAPSLCHLLYHPSILTDRLSAVWVGDLWQWQHKRCVMEWNISP